MRIRKRLASRFWSRALLCCFGGILLTVAPLPTLFAVASAHTCGSNFCSGSDGTTTTNTQGNADQFYNGEVGYYYSDLTGGDPSAKPCPSGVGGYCFIASAANQAIARYNANTGIGVEFYYFGGGADSTLAANYSSPFCFGWDQGADAATKIYNSLGPYDDVNSVFIFLDIEQNNTFGWSNATQTENRQVFDGFYDNITFQSNTHTCSGDQPAFTYQPGAYSSPDQWKYSFGSGSNSIISDTPILTSAACCSASFPSGLSGAESFGSSDHEEGYQFDENPDYDTYQEPSQAPYLGYSIGS